MAFPHGRFPQKCHNRLYSIKGQDRPLRPVLPLTFTLALPAFYYGKMQYCFIYPSIASSKAGSVPWPFRYS